MNMNIIKRILRKVVYYMTNNFIVLDHVEYDEFCNFAHHCEIKNSKIGKRSSIGRYTKIENCVLGSYCSISWNVTIGAPSHPIDRISSHAFTYRKQFGIVSEDSIFESGKTIIGNDVWIGCNSVILSGVRIGDGAIIGAGAVVTKNVDPYTIVAGVPAKIIKNRNEILALNYVEWWRLDDNSLKTNIELFKEKANLETINKLKKLMKGKK